MLCSIIWQVLQIEYSLTWSRLESLYCAPEISVAQFFSISTLARRFAPSAREYIAIFQARARNNAIHIWEPQCFARKLKIILTMSMIRPMWNWHTESSLSSAEAIGKGLHEVSIGIGLHEVSWGEGGARGATGRRKKEEKASAGYCPVLRSF